MTEEDEDYFVPLQDQRVFGAGIKRKRVPFVPAQSEPPPPSPTAPKLGLGDRYLSIVLPRTPDISDGEQTTPPVPEIQKDEPPTKDTVCPICSLRITSATSATKSKAHESSLAHQVCLEHSHPPSHLDRAHVGLKYLSAYGWDPDARRGLGASGAGIRVPIKSKIKNDTVGLGVAENDRVRVQKEAKAKARLNAKQVRKQEDAEKKREKQLREAFYGKDLEAYLGPDG
jgi:G-patch domain